MPRASVVVPDDFRELLDLVERGKLFALQEWIRGGKPLQFGDMTGSRRHLLEQAIRTGFHSVVEVLLHAGRSSNDDLAHALEFARNRSRYDIAELLEKFRARGKELDFFTACKKLDFVTAERHLRVGHDPNKDNDFARVLCDVKAKPLIGFYKNRRAEFPALDDQAALALRIAVRNRDVRWAALLVWAGADPFRLAPDDLDDFFPMDPETDNWSTAADDAMWRDEQMLKVLHLKPTPEQAVQLLSSAAYQHKVSLMKDLLAKIPRDKINDTDRNSCSALETLVKHSPRDIFTSIPNEQANAENLQCIELLLDAAARWNPDPKEINYSRRWVLRHEPRYIVQLIRLLLYTPNGADGGAVLELCRSNKLVEKIASADAALVTEIKELRKQHRVSTPNNHTANTVTESSTEETGC